MFEQLRDPAYQHLLINHVPIIGIVMGLFGLAVAFATRRRIAFLPALAILAVAGASAWPVAATGSEAYKPIRKIADDAGIDWLDTHLDRADAGTWVFYVLAGVAVVAMTVPVKWPRSGLPLVLVTAVVAVMALGVAGWIAEAGGRVRHVELRPAVVPVSDDSVEHEPTQ